MYDTGDDIFKCQEPYVKKILKEALKMENSNDKK